MGILVVSGRGGRDGPGGAGVLVAALVSRRQPSSLATVSVTSGASSATARRYHHLAHRHPLPSGRRERECPDGATIPADREAEP